MRLTSSLPRSWSHLRRDKGRFGRLGICIRLLALLASFGAGAAHSPIPGDPVHVAATDEAPLRYLDNAHVSVSQPIDPAAEGLQDNKFVQVDVAQVINPRKYGLSFEVYYQPTGAQKIRLGTFSLYPADNPGKFIVPTQGHVNREGSIIVSLLVMDPVANGVPLRVGIRKIALLGRQADGSAESRE
jgi:hypothetical protein